MMEEFIKRLKSFYGFAGSISVLLPGTTFFLGYSPPLFDMISILSSALSAAFLWAGFKSKTASGAPSEIKISLIYISVGFILTIAYLILLDETTIVVSNSTDTTRYQIGYDVAKWSITEKAYLIMNMPTPNPCGNSKIELLRCLGATNENVYLLWRKWTIYLFGTLNILVFVFSTVFWSFGFGKLMKTLD
jgi:hypothetical protein